MTKQSMLAACAAVAFLVSGCTSDDAQRAGNDAAAASANAITFHLRSSIIRAGSTPAAQFAHVKNWLSAPSPEELQQVGQPHFRVLPGNAARRIDIAVWAYGTTPAMQGKSSEWGHVCSRYTVDAAARLDAKTIKCPSGLPEQPD